MSVDLIKRIKEINHFESEGTDDFVIEGVNWWPIFRLYISTPTMHSVKPLQLESEKLALPYLKRVAWDLKLFKEAKTKLRSASHWKLKKVSRLLFSHDRHYRSKVNGKKFNSYIDPIIDEMEGDYLSICWGANAETYFSENTKSYEYVMALVDVRQKKRRLWKTLLFDNKSNFFSVRNGKKLKSLIQKIKQKDEFSSINFKALPNVIDDVLKHKEIASYLLKKTQPEEVILYSYYSIWQLGICLAASASKVPCVDYQHGSQNKWHFAYGSWMCVPSGGYDLLPSEFWVFSDREKQNLLFSFSGTKHKALIKDYFLLNFWKKHQKNREVNWLIDLKRKGYKLILFTGSSYMLKDDHLFWSYLEKTEREDVYWLIRLHPGHMNFEHNFKEKFLRCEGRYNIEDSCKEDLFELFDAIDCHMTQSSRVAEEALYFGHKTIVLDQDWRIYFEDFIDDEDMLMPLSVKELETMVEKTLNKGGEIE